MASDDALGWVGRQGIYKHHVDKTQLALGWSIFFRNRLHDIMGRGVAEDHQAYMILSFKNNNHTILVPASTETNPKPSPEPFEAAWNELESLGARCPRGENLFEGEQLIPTTVVDGDNQVSSEIGKYNSISIDNNRY